MEINFHLLKEIDIISYSLVKASWLQKCVRRSLSDKAVSIGQIYLDENQSQGLYRKLLVFCAEDIGMGHPQAIRDIELIEDPLKKVEYISKLPKNREADRFLWAVQNNYSELIKDDQTSKEARTLNLILNVAENWFNNKRLKKNKSDLVEVFDVLANNCSKKDNVELIHIIKDKYFMLSKHNSFGVKNLLAMAVLISVRDLPLTKIPPIIFDAKKIDLVLVDDFALDKHTSFGKKLNRGMEHWIKEGSVVIPERFYPELFKSDGSLKYNY